MKKPPSNGMAFLKSKYGSVEEHLSDFKIDTPPDKFKANQIRVFLAEDFEAGRPMPDDAYEFEKRTLYRYPLTAEEIQHERKKAAQRCEV